MDVMSGVGANTQCLGYNGNGGESSVYASSKILVSEQIKAAGLIALTVNCI